MLRITQTTHPSGASVIKIEGTLLEPWVAEVRTVCRAAGEGAPLLDLSAVTYADQPAMQLLQELLQQGSRIEASSPFVAELLQRGTLPC